jgi:hypothetical protein
LPSGLKVTQMVSSMELLRDLRRLRQRMEHVYFVLIGVRRRA